MKGERDRDMEVTWESTIVALNAGLSGLETRQSGGAAIHHGC
jgi:hypothetical protein